MLFIKKHEKTLLKTASQKQYNLLTQCDEYYIYPLLSGIMDHQNFIYQIYRLYTSEAATRGVL